MKNKSSRALAFIETRQHHLQETAEDYVELIADLIAAKGEAKVSDMAIALGVSHVTVIRTIDRLKTKGLIMTSNNQPIYLTKEGELLANFCKERHDFLLKFLIQLGVPESTAKIDVEGMEHHVSKITIDAFSKHLKKIK